MSDDVPPLRAHDWVLRNGQVERNRTPKESIRLSPLQKHRLCVSRNQRMNEEIDDPAMEPEPIEFEPIPEPAKRTAPVRSQHDDICSNVAALVRNGYSYSDAMDSVLDDVPLNQKLYNATTKLNDALGRIKNRATSLLEGQKEGDTDVA